MFGYKKAYYRHIADISMIFFITQRLNRQAGLRDIKKAIIQDP